MIEEIKKVIENTTKTALNEKIIKKEEGKDDSLNKRNDKHESQTEGKKPQNQGRQNRIEYAKKGIIKRELRERKEKRNNEIIKNVRAE